MGQTVISAHTRGRHSAQKFSVTSYTQNRKDGKKKKGKGRTACQQMIGKVIGFDYQLNATPEQLRTDPAWRSYVCNCTDSHFYKLITEGQMETINGAGPVKDFTFTAPNWGDPKKGFHKVTIKGRVQTIKSHIAHSHCGVDIVIPEFTRALQGRSIAYLVASA